MPGVFLHSTNNVWHTQMFKSDPLTFRILHQSFELEQSKSLLIGRQSIGDNQIILLDFSLTVKAAPHECVIRTIFFISQP